MMAAEQQRAEELAARRFVDEQERQMAAASAQTSKDDALRQPEIKMGDKSSEEKALEKEQVRFVTYPTVCISGDVGHVPQVWVALRQDNSTGLDPYLVTE